MSPSECSPRARRSWSARGDSNPDLHGLNVPRLPIAPRAVGPSGWTRTTTTRVKSPACCVDTTEGSWSRYIRSSWSEWRDSNPHLKAWKARRQPLPHIRSGSAYGYRTRPTALAARHAASTRRPNKDPVHATCVGCQRPRSCELGGRQGIRTQSLPRENGVTARQRTIRTYRPYGDSARIRTRTRELWRLGCFSYTTLPMSTSVTIVCEERTSLRPGGTLSRPGQTKKAFQGIAPEGLFRDECRAFRARCLRYRAGYRSAD